MSSSGAEILPILVIPPYSGAPYCVINDNIPFFTNADHREESFAYYSPPDELGRCQTAFASIGVDLMPGEERGI